MKKISRRSFVKAAGSAAVLSMLAACGGSSSSTAASTASTAASTAGASSAAAASFGPDTQAIVDRGVLKVGVKNAVQGFSFQDTLTGEYKGLEDSLAEMIAEYLGVDVEFTTVTAATPFWQRSPSPRSARRAGISPLPTTPIMFPFWSRTPTASRIWQT